MSEPPRVLVVEDEPNVLRFIERVLTAEGYPTWAVQSAEDALVVLEAEGGAEMLLADALTDALDVMVTDIKLPGMHGGDLARQVLKRWPSTRILFLSGYGAEDLIRKGVCPEDMPLLQKPFAPDVLVQRVRETLREPPWYPAAWREATDARD